MLQLVVVVCIVLIFYMKISWLEKGTITNDEEKQKLEYLLKVDKDRKRNFLQIVCEISEANVLLKLELTV